MKMEHSNKHMSWKNLLIMAILSFMAMYILMYAMVDRYQNVYSNLNQLYMVMVMTAAMMLIEIAVMNSMYERKVKVITASVSVIALILFWSFTRNQTAISDKEFLKSMIPHHGAAVLMCKKAPIVDPEIKQFCDAIISGQQSEIDWMQNKLLAF